MSAGAVTPAPPHMVRTKILVVDDDRDNLLALQAILEPLDQDLMLAASGLDALRMCLDNDFAAILLDVRDEDPDYPALVLANHLFGGSIDARLTPVFLAALGA